MERSFERGEPSNPSDKNQGRAGDLTRKLAKAQLGKGIRELSSPHTGLLSLIHISDEQSSLVVHRPRIVSLDADWYQSSENPQTHKKSIDISSRGFSLEKNSPLPLEQQEPIFERVLAEKFLDIYENKHHRCAAIEFLEKSGEKSVARKLVEQLNDERLEKDLDTKLKMISAIGKLGDPSVVPKLLTTLSSNGHDSRVYGAIAGVAVMLNRQVAVPELIERLYDYKKTNFDNCSMMALAIGMSGDQSAVQKLERLLSVSPYIRRNQVVRHAIEMLGSPSVGKALVKVFSDQKMYAPMLQDVPYVVGKLGDISVAHELVDMLSCYKGFSSHTFDNIPKAIEEISIRLGNSEEIKEISKKLIKVTYKDNYDLEIEMMQNIYEAVSGLGKRLHNREEIKELSKELGAKLFDERMLPVASPAIANAMFELERHLAEPDPLRRILNPQEAREKACKNIKEEILNYRKKFAEEGKKDISVFYEMLSKAAFSNNTRLEMRIGVFRPIMEEKLVHHLQTC